MTTPTESQRKTERPWHHNSITLTARQLRNALEFVAPDFDADEDRRESEVSIAICPPGFRDAEDGSAIEPGPVAWLTEYPEEGHIPLRDEWQPVPVAATAPGPLPDYGDMSREALERHAARMAQALADDRARSFWQKHALGPKMLPSCLCCGRLPEKVAIMHAELPGIVVCQTCRDAASAAPTLEHVGQAVAQVYTMEALVPGGGVKHHVTLHRPLPAGTKLFLAPSSAPAEAPAVQAAPAVPDGRVTGREAMPYGIIDPDYARIFTMARVLAWSEGYAIAFHGSFTRDLDLIAIPWTDKACEPAHLVRRIENAGGLKNISPEPGIKPHGRLAWTLVFPAFDDPRFVDFSVMPRASQAAKGGAA